VVGTRLWATAEAAVPEDAYRRATAATCDDTVRTTVYDIVRAFDWPEIYNGRLLRNDFLNRWHNREHELRSHLAEVTRAFTRAKETDDYSIGNIIVGEAIGLIRDVRPAGGVLAEMVREPPPPSPGSPYRQCQPSPTNDPGAIRGGYFNSSVWKRRPWVLPQPIVPSTEEQSHPLIVSCRSVPCALAGACLRYSASTLNASVQPTVPAFVASAIRLASPLPWWTLPHTWSPGAEGTTNALTAESPVASPTGTTALDPAMGTSKAAAASAKVILMPGTIDHPDLRG
jgi:hypothetical protein